MIDFIYKRFISTVVIVLLMAFSSMLSSCEGCSRYGVKNRASENSRDYSKPVVIQDNSNDQSEGNVNNSLNETPSNLPLQELYKKNKSAVFIIYTVDGKYIHQGSGFFVSSDGVGVSNYHVFKGTTKGFEKIILESKEEFRVHKIIDLDKKNDFIIFKVEASHSVNYLKLADKLPEIGEEVFAIGNPKGLDHTLSKGIVSGYRENNKIIQTTAEITHGSSGGPLLNMKGEIIGITSSGMGEADLNFAVNINLLKKTLSSLLVDNNINNYRFYPIKKFVDGDTFWIDDGTEKGVKIRFIGVDAPESRNTFNKKIGYFGKEAKEYVKKLLSGKKVRLEYDVEHYDRYGRTLAYIFLEDGTFLNAKLVKEGYAVVMTIPPNVRYVNLFIKLQREARLRKRGLWNR